MLYSHQFFSELQTETENEVAEVSVQRAKKKKGEVEQHEEGEEDDEVLVIWTHKISAQHWKMWTFVYLYCQLLQALVTYSVCYKHCTALHLSCGGPMCTVHRLT